ncbi:hypothetical protein [Flammeovirga aprica]|uniref:Uncharacterized protein n=1 Tax=Flammeovirga aprica JL-4 TaxID=694437 RepID=A0A7X9XDI1_9BACT|nr:hypothetical protein [Flammeovirga aprica]NME72823.1 hypothetical protein [Flammeovirga aprica JL-4]
MCDKIRVCTDCNNTDFWREIEDEYGNVQVYQCTMCDTFDQYKVMSKEAYCQEYWGMSAEEYDEFTAEEMHKAELDYHQYMSNPRNNKSTDNSDDHTPIHYDGE